MNNQFSTSTVTEATIDLARLEKRTSIEELKGELDYCQNLIAYDEKSLREIKTRIESLDRQEEVITQRLKQIQILYQSGNELISKMQQSKESTIPSSSLKPNQVLYLKPHSRLQQTQLTSKEKDDCCTCGKFEEVIAKVIDLHKGFSGVISNLDLGIWLRLNNKYITTTSINMDKKLKPLQLYILKSFDEHRSRRSGGGDPRRSAHKYVSLDLICGDLFSCIGYEYHFNKNFVNSPFTKQVRVLIKEELSLLVDQGVIESIQNRSGKWRINKLGLETLAKNFN